MSSPTPPYIMHSAVIIQIPETRLLGGNISKCRQRNLCRVGSKQSALQRSQADADLHTVPSSRNKSQA